MRFRFGPALEHAVRVRGLDLVRVAEIADVAPSTVSAALRGHRLNVGTATRIAKAVASCAIVPELDAWADISGETNPPATHRDADAREAPPPDQRNRRT